MFGKVLVMSLCAVVGGLAGATQAHAAEVPQQVGPWQVQWLSFVAPRGRCSAMATYDFAGNIIKPSNIPWVLDAPSEVPQAITIAVEAEGDHFTLELMNDGPGGPYANWFSGGKGVSYDVITTYTAPAYSVTQLAFEDMGAIRYADGVTAKLSQAQLVSLLSSSVTFTYQDRSVSMPEGNNLPILQAILNCDHSHGV